MNDYTMKSGTYCESCDKDADQWPGKMGIMMATDYGRMVVYCKPCFRLWLEGEDEIELEVAEWDDF